jgi:hypothetical protein
MGAPFLRERSRIQALDDAEKPEKSRFFEGIG